MKIPTIRIEGYRENKGKGYAVRKGVSIAEGGMVIYTDVDFPYEVEGLISIYKSLCYGKWDVVLGIRDENYYANVPVMRKLISRFLKFLLRFLLDIPTTDTQAGLKGFNRKGREIFLKTSIDRYLFDLEFIVLAVKLKASICCNTVMLKPQVSFSRMNLSILMQEALNLVKILMNKH